MTRLPKRFTLYLLLFIFVFCFFKLSTNVFALTNLPNPQNVFHPTKQSLDNDRIKAREQAAIDGKTIVTGGEAADYLLFANFNNFANGIYCPPTVCGDQPTALGTVTNLIATVYAHPPASGIAYVADTLANAGLIVKPAYAQGIGFAGLTSLLPIWKTTRNIAYAVIVLVMVAIGFMIIFRMKIDPKTVISIQMAIPKIVLTLVLITFSYAIVGFLIDLMYLAMALVVSLLLDGMGRSSQEIAQMQTHFMTGNMFHLGGYVFRGLGTLDDIARSLSIQVPITSGLTGAIIVALSGWSWLTFGAGTAAISVIFVAIVLLGLLFTFIRLLILLFNSYIQILIALILGPIQLLAEAIPGKSSFSGWILNIIANLSVFPTTVAVLLLGVYISSLPVGKPLWMAPLIGMPNLGGSASTQDTNLFGAFLGLGIIFIAPNLVASVKKMFGPKPMLPVSPGTLMAPLTGSFQTGMGAASQFYYMKPIIDMVTKKGQPPKGP